MLLERDVEIEVAEKSDDLEEYVDEAHEDPWGVELRHMQIPDGEVHFAEGQIQGRAKQETDLRRKGD